MKKFLLYSVAIFAILAAILTYILYSEGAFETYDSTKEKKLEPFMKCEAGKCAPGKCGGDTEKRETKTVPAKKCVSGGKCAEGKCGNN
ncbi:MAG: hypothetical protein DRG09_03925 [Epsilonproteobacteria bacterium]|nr:MAG: hypothetical protein DRG09_03925 [Campylobacterota bacterium]